jgi:hypothetical protein
MGVNLGANNPIYGYQPYIMAGSPTFQQQTVKSHLIDLGTKFHILGNSYRIRPFIGGGGAYMKTLANFSQSYLNMVGAYPGAQIAPDYDVNTFLAYVSAGLDIRVTKNISINATFKYYAILSSTENVPFGNMYGYGYGFGAPSPTYAQMAAGSSLLASAGLYSVTAGVNFSF